VSVESEALDLLNSLNFFDYVRGALRRAGLPEPHLKFGLGLYVASVSRFADGSLRVYINEGEEGDALRLVSGVAMLLPTADRAGIFREFAAAWRAVKSRPDGKLLYVPDVPNLALRGDELRVGNAASAMVKQVVKGQFVVATTQPPPYEGAGENRWLTIDLPAVEKIDSAEAEKRAIRDETEYESWQHAQRLIRARYAKGVYRPMWAKRVFDEMRRDFRKRRHVHGLSKIWDAVTLMRSFCREASDQIQADFSSYAVSSLLLRNSFREGWAIPSAQKLYREITPANSRTSVVNPTNGRGKRYEHWTLRRRVGTP
jgi:hypothetical protein